MHVPAVLTQAYTRLTDAVFERRVQPVPPAVKLRSVRIISHRGDFDNRAVKENTLTAFERVQSAGVWGLELDIRWTRDLEPVVIHDPDLVRVYGRHGVVARCAFSELREDFPEIPSLTEVVERFGNKVHLMLEVKKEPWLNRSRQILRLEKILAPLEPGRDYHLLTLHPETLAPFAGTPHAARIAISQSWPNRLSRWIREQSWAGVCGHYLLMRNDMIGAHHRLGQKVGTGFVQSRNCLFREINRGVDWIFSNDAVGLQRIVNRHVINERQAQRT